MICGAPVCYSGLRSGCHICQRRARYGFMAVAIGTVWDAESEAYAGRVDDGPFLEDARVFYFNALDALAEIMEDRTRLVRSHRRALDEEIRDAQRAARDGYQEGLNEGRAGER